MWGGTHLQGAPDTFRVTSLGGPHKSDVGSIAAQGRQTFLGDGEEQTVIKGFRVWTEVGHVFLRGLSVELAHIVDTYSETKLD